MAQKKNKNKPKYYFGLRAGLTIVILAVMFLLFFLCGGVNYFKPAIAFNSFKELPFEIHFIDVGLGDSIFMRLPDGKTMLVDCGPNVKSNTVVDYLDELFNYEGIKSLDYFVLTHQDADHVGKGAAIFENFVVKNLYRPKVLSKSEVEFLPNPNGYKSSDTATYDNVIMAAYNEQGCEIHYNKKDIKFYDDNFEVKFLSPALNDYSNNNDYSPMIMVTYNSRKFLLTGDGETVAEDEVLALHNKGDINLQADVLKVAHHGSKSSSSAKFLAAVSPSYAIISAPIENRWSFPNEEVVDRLNAVNAGILQTGLLGSIAISVDSESKIVIADHETGFIIDVPFLFVGATVGVLIVWGIPAKVKKKDKNA